MNFKNKLHIVVVIVTVLTIGFVNAQALDSYAQAPSATGASTDDGSAGSASSSNSYGGASDSASASGKSVNCNGNSYGLSFGNIDVPPYEIDEFKFGSASSDCDATR